MLENYYPYTLIEWISNRKTFLLIAAALLIIGAILASQLFTWRTLKSEQDFFQAYTLADKENWDQLDNIIKRHPELKPKYQGKIAQSFLIKGETAEAQELIEDIFQRNPNLPFYQDYTQGSLLIAKKSYDEALAKAEQLKSNLAEAGKENYPNLYTLNLVRLSLLYQTTGQNQKELDTLEELLQQKDSYLAASDALKVGHISLNEYIQERKNAL